MSNTIYHSNKGSGSAVKVSRAFTPFRSEASAGQVGAATGRGNEAFTLIEIMVSVGLLTVIILGLVGMFNQVQRALLSSNTQTDVLEAGRGLNNLMANDFEQITACDTNGGANFYSTLEVFPGAALPTGIMRSVLPLNDPPDVRTNFMSRFCFVTRYNQQWSVIGYAVDWHRWTLTNSFGVAQLGKGVLYRFCTNNVGIDQLSNVVNAPYNGVNPYQSGFNAIVNWCQNSGSNDWSMSSTNGWQISRIADGVVHLRVQVYDTNGFLATNGVQLAMGTISYGPKTNLVCPTINVTNYTDFPSQLNEYSWGFYSNAVPAYVSLELGILEARTVDRLNAMTNNPGFAYNYYINHAAQMHFFHQRVPVRNVDPAAYQ